jgi:hypothetical protein
MTDCRDVIDFYQQTVIDYILLHEWPHDDPPRTVREAIARHRKRRERGFFWRPIAIAMTLETAGGGSGPVASLQRLLARTLPATPQDRAAALWSFAYFFTLLAGYYVLRPLRDQMAISAGIIGPTLQRG